jgi:hypothetical protein
MDAQLSEFINILTDNRLIIKRYKIENIEIKNPRYYNFEFNEKLLISTDEYCEDELLNIIESELRYITIPTSFVLNGCTQSGNLENFLDSEFEKFRIFVVNNYKNIEKSQLNDIIGAIKNSKNELENLLSANKQNRIMILDGLISGKIDFCSETIRFINNPLFILNNTSDRKRAKPKKSLENLTSLTQNQIVILFHYLKQLGYIGKDMPKNMYAQHIAELTGFAEEKIRQDLSHIENNSNSIESTEFLENDYNVVKRGLEKVIAALKKDLLERYPPKS